VRVVDVTEGNNSVAFVQDGRTFAIRGYRAGPGYDLVTGVGTIKRGPLRAGTGRSREDRRRLKPVRPPSPIHRCTDRRI
jgi:hypothetical protein